MGGHDVRDLTLDSLRAAIGLVLEDSFLFSDTHPGQHRLRPPGRDRRRGRGGGAGRAGARLHHGAAGGLRHRGRRAGPDPVRRPAAAGRAGPGAGHRPGRAGARRRHLGGGRPDSRRAIHAALRSAMAGRTTLLIAHRHSTLALADRIAVLDEGRVVDVGHARGADRALPAVPAAADRRGRLSTMDACRRRRSRREVRSPPALWRDGRRSRPLLDGGPRRCIR